MIYFFFSLGFFILHEEAGIYKIMKIKLKDSGRIVKRMFKIRKNLVLE